MVTSVLKKRGHRVHTAGDGEEGLERALSLRPDLIISDIMMPKLDGWALLRALRAHPELAQTPVLLLTALSSDEDRIRGLRLGADDYLPKPFRFEELDLRVASALRKRRLPESVVRLPQAPVAAHAAPPLDGEGAGAGGTLSGVHGSLEQLSLGSLLSMIEMERKSGILVVQRGAETGRLVCRTGRLLAAELLSPSGTRGAPGRSERGIEVIYRMLTWHSGRFDFTSGEVHADDEIGIQITHLLMEGARRLDEAGAETGAETAEAAPAAMGPRA